MAGTVDQLRPLKITRGYTRTRGGERARSGRRHDGALHGQHRP